MAIKSSKETIVEFSYVDLLSGLKKQVVSDTIQADEKRRILYHINALMNLLWKYSS